MPPIEVVCPNGHKLRVKDEFAGKWGLCPVCGVRMKVPEKPRDDLSEDEILELLGPASGKSEPEQSPEVTHRVSGPEAAPRPPKKICEKCNREVLAETRICPYCRTYIGLAGSYPKF